MVALRYLTTHWPLVLVKHESHWVKNDIKPSGEVPLWSALSLALVPYHYNLFPQGYTVCEAGTK